MASIQAAIREARSYLGFNTRQKGWRRTKLTDWLGLIGSWSAAFLAFIAHRIRLVFTGAPSDRGFAYCPHIEAWAKANARWFNRGEGQAGDWVLFELAAEGVADHVELVISIHEGRLTTIGVGSDGEVREEEHPEDHVRGYMRPIFDSATPEHAPGRAVPMRILRVQAPVMRGVDVRRVQTRLLAFGFRVTINGEYDLETALQVMAFQSEHRLKVNGVVDHVTAARLGISHTAAGLAAKASPGARAR